jgi:hypothetical protein
LLYLYFEDIYVFLPFLLNFIIFWVFFFKINFFLIKNNFLSIDTLQKSSVTYSFHNSFFLNINKIFLFILFIYIYTFKGISTTIWWQHFKLTNLNLNLIILLLFINFIFLLICQNISLLNNFVRLDYFFALTNLSNFLPLLFLANTLFTFLFILEFTSTLVFYKFVVSKIWKNDDNSNINNFILFRNLPNYYLNMLFFQYWATFFSSVLIVFSLISYIYIYGTTEWFLINLLNSFNLQFNLNKFNNIILIFILIFGFLIKIGFTPVHLYKIELYKGLPFFAIFFYTTYYFLVFFMFFILLILLFFESFTLYWIYILTFIFIMGLVFVISLLFGVNYIKAFFAYSSVVNSLGFITIIISLLNI